MRFFFKVVKVYKKGGVPFVLQRVKERLFETNSAWWLVRDLSEPIQEYPSPFSLHITSERYADVVNYMKLKDHITEPEIEVASRMGHWFLGLIANGSIRGFCKCGFTKVYINDFQKIITLPRNLAFIYEYEIDESLRGKGVGYFFISSVLQRFSSAGYDFAACHIPIWNRASFNVVEKCGFKKQDFVRFFRLLGARYTTRNVSELLQNKCITHL